MSYYVLLCFSTVLPYKISNLTHKITRFYDIALLGLHLHSVRVSHFISAAVEEEFINGRFSSEINSSYFTVKLISLPLFRKSFRRGIKKIFRLY